MKTADFYNVTTPIGLARKRSRELDFGVWWYDGARRAEPHRVTWVASTGEVYANGAWKQEYEVLGIIKDEQEVERRLEGWAEECGKPNSLDWIKERVK